MSTTLEQAPLEQEAQPVLYVMTGHIYSAPLDFPIEFAREFDVTHVPKATGVTEVLAEHLTEDEDVIYDQYLLTPHSRESFVNLARNCGALIVALNMHAPKSDMIDRLREHRARDLEQGASPTKIRRYSFKFKKSQEIFKRPILIEGIDHIVELDSSGDDIEPMLDEVEAKLVELELID